ncbi:hypothetical protein [Natrialba asiatica]|uniref:Uncharacterized protein n=1 Tax=Natrialba asiatica (strain ATCC 700177 / DSM 12278 / JCM 9576 / FERM P-10747 / NBRC 102637 / 172P1) TaxID=29540 RepID=M0ALR6_NATA1|nr:hypothetical protein [Natrialba asiatica]ELY99291.1 hypothetical protein C481_15610 [Natrialba asiatica DSM 12278]
MTSSDDDGYVHDPTAFNGPDDRGAETETAEADSDGEWTDAPRHPATAEREFDWRGWILVGAIVLAFVVAPLSILLWPPHLNYFVALLILPLLPAALLALTAVWATTRP